MSDILLYPCRRDRQHETGVQIQCLAYTQQPDDRLGRVSVAAGNKYSGAKCIVMRGKTASLEDSGRSSEHIRIDVIRNQSVKSLEGTSPCPNHGTNPNPKPNHKGVYILMRSSKLVVPPRGELHVRTISEHVSPTIKKLSFEGTGGGRSEGAGWGRWGERRPAVPY